MTSPSFSLNDNTRVEHLGGRPVGQLVPLHPGVINRKFHTPKN